MAYIVMAYTVMVYIGMAHIVMAHIVMAWVQFSGAWIWCLFSVQTLWEKLLFQKILHNVCCRDTALAI